MSCAVSPSSTLGDLGTIRVSAFIRSVATATLFLVLGGGGKAVAANLTLECSVTESETNGSHTSFKIRYDINLEALGVSEYHDMGLGYKLSDSHRFVRADDKEIVLRDDASEKETINRITGEMYWIDLKKGTVQKGTCAEQPRPQ